MLTGKRRGVNQIVTCWHDRGGGIQLNTIGKIYLRCYKWNSHFVSHSWAILKLMPWKGKKKSIMVCQNHDFSLYYVLISIVFFVQVWRQRSKGGGGGGSQILIKLMDLYCQEGASRISEWWVTLKSINWHMSDKTFADL